jgi:hypothetical protein
MTIVNKDKRRALFCVSKNKHISDSAQILQIVSLIQAGTKNEICVSLVYSGNVNEILFPFPLYTRKMQISFFVPGSKIHYFPFWRENLSFWKVFGVFRKRNFLKPSKIDFFYNF